MSSYGILLYFRDRSFFLGGGGGGGGGGLVGFGGGVQKLIQRGCQPKKYGL